MKTSEKIKKAIDINWFIALLKKIIDNVDEDLVDQIVGKYSADWKAETDEEKIIKNLWSRNRQQKLCKYWNFIKNSKIKEVLDFLYLALCILQNLLVSLAFSISVVLDINSW